MLRPSLRSVLTQPGEDVDRLESPARHHGLSLQPPGEWGDRPGPEHQPEHPCGHQYNHG